jgi:hypothetical protein
MTKRAKKAKKEDIEGHCEEEDAENNQHTVEDQGYLSPAKLEQDGLHMKKKNNKQKTTNDSKNATGICVLRRNKV